ncbi:acyltransferase [Novosphingobium mangrovi (ex Huang et al. 2023)]|uniref:Acyltransferase n=1 Tax=Novosphingobium mangrovi (ex Huang et al. 2023) TaxID=2976432 RepID=A0ABT2I0R8_9SPHN|nr:acyltransferase [Novosphingobium mangrovi (ex Huang et al. 2023)]MCT2398396.1 acyltransferase [Novosphingobium mangrovi (ex Huang et al. 2023)]
MARNILGNGILLDSQTDSHGRTQEVARGYLLICVFYIHAMIGVSIHMGPNAWASLYQLKLLAPDVSAFFLLSGMAAPKLANKGIEPVLRNSATLLLFAIISHVVGFAIILIGQSFPSAWDAAKAFGRPLVYGVGYSSFVAWFFVVLAIARVLAYLFLRSWIRFGVIAAALVALVWTTKKLGLPDNIYEWRNWPTATLFFLIGMKMPHGKAIPNWAAVTALILSTVLALINRHGLFRAGPCLSCDLHFVPQPMIGQYGSIFVYVPQQLLFGLFLVWAAQRSAGMMIGKVGQFFGQASLAILLLHGWVLLTLYPGMLTGMPKFETPFLFVGIFSAAIVVHALLYVCLRTPLNWLQMQVFAISRIGQRSKTAKQRKRPQAA